MLSDSSSPDSESDNDQVQLTINEHFAKAYSYRKEREELQKLKDKYGSDPDTSDPSSEEDSEDLESEDEDGEELTPAVDAAILRTLARIRQKDPAIYEKDKVVFEEERQKTEGKAVSTKRENKEKDKSKPLTIRQQALSSLLTRESISRSPSPAPITHTQEQKALRDETIAAFHQPLQTTSDSDSEEDDSGGLLIPRAKTQDELKREEEEYREFLEREIRDVVGDGGVRELVWVEEGDIRDETRDDEKGKMKMKKEGKAKGKEKRSEKSKEEKAKEDQEFLMSYILNRGWIDRSAKRVPTYQEITHSSKSSTKNAKGKGKAKAEEEEEENGTSGHSSSDEEAPAKKGVDADDGEGDAEEEDDEFEEVAERFESSYNFRFEEPNAGQIQTFPRTLPSIVRRPDTTRTEARQRRKERKEEEKMKKREEVARLKALKLKELRKKLEEVGREGGVGDSAALHELDLDGEWDPEKHDQQMATLYQDDYFDPEDVMGEGEEYPIEEDIGEKPTWNDDIDVTDLVGELSGDEDQAGSSKSKKKKKKKKGKDQEGVEGVDMDVMDADVDMGDLEEEWDGTEEMRKKKLEEYMESLYELDFNDMVGDLPTRFKYTSVPSNAYALTPAEILMATDQELNQYVGIKQYAPYKKGVKWDTRRNERLKELKGKLSERAPPPGITLHTKGGVTEGGEQGKKRKGKKERMRLKGLGGDGDEGGKGGKLEDQDGAGSKRKAMGSRADVEEEGKGTMEGEPVKKKRRRHKKAGIES